MAKPTCNSCHRAMRFNFGEERGLAVDLAPGSLRLDDSGLVMLSAMFAAVSPAAAASAELTDWLGALRLEPLRRAHGKGQRVTCFTLGRVYDAGAASAKFTRAGPH
jgi:hypothetical protein